MRLWSAEDDAELRRRAGEGESFTVIARDLGVTRNAAIARARRLGFSNGRPPGRTDRARGEWTGARPAPRPKAERPPQAPRDPFVAHRAEIAQATQACELAVLPGEPEPLHAPKELGAGCRWIRGDVRGNEWRQCGQPRMPGSSWCAAHRPRTVSPAAQTVRERTFRNLPRGLRA